MPPGPRRLEQLEIATGIRATWLEKTLRLQEVIVALQNHQQLKGRLALKGGTALSIFHLGLARLSIDLDFNYIGTADRDVMLAERPVIEAIVERTAAGANYGVRRLEEAYASTSWNLGYTSAFGGPDALRVQINYLHRVPLFGVREIRSVAIADEEPITGLTVSPEELTGGKAKALVERSAARDLFDIYRLTIQPIPGMDSGRQRIAFILFAATLAEDVRTRTAASVLGAVDERDIHDNLLPALRRDQLVGRETMVAAVAPFLDDLLRWRTGEKAFFDAIASGRIEAAHLAEDRDLQGKIETHPALRWKVENVAAHLKGDRPPAGRRRGRPRR